MISEAECDHPGEYLRMGDHSDMTSRFVPEDLDPDTLYCLRCEGEVDLEVESPDTSPPKED